MSMRPWSCGRCQGPCRFLGLQLLAGQETGTSYGVSWGCSACDYKALDVCPLGPLVPSDADCLNCGVAYPTARYQGRLPRLRFDTKRPPSPSSAPNPFLPTPARRRATSSARGLFRRGLALLNHALVEEDMGQETPWMLKCYVPRRAGLARLIC